MKLHLIHLLLAIIPLSALAQSDAELLRYSLTNNYGTARSAGLGGAFNALGADFSSLSANPAGIARFSSMEMTITPAISIINSSSSFLGSTIADNKVRFGINNLGIIFPMHNTHRNSNSNLNLGIGINRLSNFNEKFSLSGYNRSNSLLDAYAETLDGESTFSATNNFPFDASLAYAAELLVADSALNYYTATNRGNVSQQLTVEKSGSINEMVISAGGYINKKISIGGTIGVPFLGYDEDYFHRERDVNDSAQGFIYFDYSRSLRTSGTGLNAKLGVLYEVSDIVRLGIALHTPTIYWMNDRYNATMYSDFDSFYVEASSPDGAYEYRMVTPWKANLGAAFIHPKIGLISLEYEVTDPGMAKYRFKDDDPDSKSFEGKINALTDIKYKIVSTVKAGIEGKIKDFRLRAGIQYRSSPFAKDFQPEGINASALAFSAGAGYRGKHFFADIAYQQWNSEEVYLPYTLKTGSAPAANISWKKPALLFTIGYKL